MTDKAKFDQALCWLRSTVSNCCDISLKTALNQLIHCLSLCNTLSTFDFSRYTFQLSLLHSFARDFAQTFAILSASQSSHSRRLSLKYLDRLTTLRHMLNVTGFYYSFQPSLLTATAISALHPINAFRSDPHRVSMLPPLSLLEPCPSPHHVLSVLRSLNSIYACLEDLCASPIDTACPAAAIRKAYALQSLSAVGTQSSTATSVSFDTHRFFTVLKVTDSFQNNLRTGSVSQVQRDILTNFIYTLLGSPFVIANALPTTLAPFLTHHPLAFDRSPLPICSDHMYGAPTSAIPVTIKSFQISDRSEGACLRFRLAVYRLRAIQHTSIVTLHAAYWPFSVSRQQFDNLITTKFAHLITERMGTCLFNIYSSPVLSISHHRIIILWDVLSALVALHHANICHGSINARTVLLRANQHHLYGNVKLDVPILTDIAFATLATASAPLDALIFRPPEKLRYDGGDYLTSDVWSFGILACILLSYNPCQNPFREQNFTYLTRNGHLRFAQYLLQNISDVTLKSLLSRCFRVNPVERITSFDLKEILATYLNVPHELAALSSRQRNIVPDLSLLDKTGNSEYLLGRDLWYLEKSLDTSRAPSTSQTPPAQNITNITLASPLTEEPLCLAPPTSLHQERPIVNSQPSKPVDPHPDRHTALQESQTPTNGPVLATNCTNDTILSNESSPENSGNYLEHRLKSIAHFGAARAADQVVSSQMRSHVKEEQVNENNMNKDVAVKGVSPRQPTGPIERSFIPPIAQSGTPRNPSVKAEPSMAVDDPVNSSPKQKRTRKRLKRRVHSDDSDYSDPVSGSKNFNLEVGQQSYVSTDSKLMSEGLGSEAGRKLRARRVSYAESSSDDDDQIATTSNDEVESYVKHEPLEDDIWSQQLGENVLIIPRREPLHKESLENPSSLQAAGPPATQEPSRGTNKNDTPIEQRTQKKRRVPPSKGRPPEKPGVKDDIGRGRNSVLPDQPHHQEEGPHTSGWAEFQIGLSLESGPDGSQKPQQAIEYFRVAAKAGCQTAKVRLGNCYEHGLGTEKNSATAAGLYISAASANNRDALFHAGRCYERGVGVVQNRSLALEHYAKASEFGHVPSMMKAAEIYKVDTPGAEGLTKAFRMYSLANRHGDLEAKVKLAECYAKSLGTRRNIQRAVELYREAANAGNPAAILAMGLLYEDGCGVKKNPDLALKFYRKSAAMNHGPGITALGQCYVWAYGVEHNYPEAQKLFTKAANLGHGLAFHELGMMYKDGNGVEQDYGKAVAYFRAAAERNCEVAMVQLGDCLYHGNGVAKNYREAFETFRKGAELGAQEAWRWLGDCYADGIGVDRDGKKALENYRKAADLGSASALTSLASCYENGVGVNTNMARAVTLYRRAAEAGDPTAHNNLGILYEKGNHIKVDFSRAVDHYKRAVEYGSVEAMCNLADCYAAGCGVKKDLETAFKWYSDGAKHGNAGAQCELGLCYLYGRGVEKDVSQALALLHMAADREAEAARQLGRAYMEGKDIKKNQAKSFEFFLSAAKMGNADACYDVGNCFRLGYGVDPDENQAVKYYEKATEAGNDLSKAALGNLLFNKGKFSEAFELLSTVVTPTEV